MSKETMAPSCCQPGKDLQSMSTKNGSITPVKEKPLRTFTGPKSKITIIYDVGFSNTLFIRGKGANLSWDKGLPLKNVSENKWIWETSDPFTTCEFKVLINDTTYEQGDNHTLTCGAAIQYTPNFN